MNQLQRRGYSIKFGPMHNGEALIARHRPRLVYLSNTGGARQNVRVALACKKQNISLVSGIAEGNLAQMSKEHAYGWNLSHQPLEDRLLVWSARFLKQLLSVAPEYEAIATPTGYPGVDRYHFVPADRSWIDVHKRRIGAQMVVGVGCWEFPSDARRKTIENDAQASQIKKTSVAFHHESRDKFDAELQRVMLDNPNTLFLLKMHPGSRGDLRESGIECASQLQNALLVSDQQSIQQCLAASDLWVTYESTTAMEAWLMSTPSVTLNPNGPNFPQGRTVIWQAQPLVESSGELNRIIKNVSAGNEIPGYSECLEKQQRALEIAYEFLDGLNHVRCAVEIEKVLCQTQQGPVGATVRSTITSNTKALRYYLMRMLRRVPAWSGTEIDALARQRAAEQEAFYATLGAGG